MVTPTRMPSANPITAPTAIATPRPMSPRLSWVPRCRSSDQSPIDDARARELLARERERIESSLADSARNRESEVAGLDQHPADDAERLQGDEVDEALDAHLREDLEAVERAERRLEEGTYGLSIESGEPSPPRASRRSPGRSAPRRSRSATSAEADGPPVCAAEG